MGAVYEAFQEDLRRLVAVKVIAQPITDEALRRFRLEARAAAALQHPHIVQVYDFHIGDGELPYMVMELLPGRPLRELMREAPLSPERVARIGSQILDALAAAHRAGVIHRDLKPGNIMVQKSGNGDDHAKLVDFGAAKVLFGSQAAITSTGSLIGTLSYMSPEQALVLDLDGRADVYAIALCMYAACVGKNPFVSESPDVTLKAIVAGRCAPLTKACPNIDPEFAAIVHRGMARDRSARYATAQEMSAALDTWLDGGPSGASLRPYEVGDAPSGLRRPRTLGALVVGGALIGAVGAAWLTRGPERAPQPAAASPPGRVARSAPASPPSDPAPSAPESGDAGIAPP